MAGRISSPKKVAGRIDYLAGRILNPKKVAGRIDYLAGRILNPKKVAGRNGGRNLSPWQLGIILVQQQQLDSWQLLTAGQIGFF